MFRCYSNCPISSLPRGSFGCDGVGISRPLWGGSLLTGAQAEQSSNRVTVFYGVYSCDKNDYNFKKEKTLE
eukprot:2424064-Amphidinium_carterae.1